MTDYRASALTVYTRERLSILASNVHTRSTDKKRVQFRAPHRLIDRADALAEVLESDRADVLVTPLREYLQDATQDDALTQEIAAASYDDVHGRAASAVIERSDGVTTRSVDLDATFPLDDGEYAAVTPAHDVDAALVCCDEFTHLGLIHASLADTRLVTTPTLLSVFVRTGALSAGEARVLLDDISEARSWDANSYVQRARSLLEEP